MLPPLVEVSKAGEKSTVSPVILLVLLGVNVISQTNWLCLGLNLPIVGGVSTVPLNNRARGGQGDVHRTLKICRMLICDRDDMVIKALSWALRELSKRYPVPVSSFLEQYDEQLAARVKREVTNKLRTGLKNPRRVSDS
jgi:hypothetical protein